jgi:hypothetical protein
MERFTKSISNIRTPKSRKFLLCPMINDISQPRPAGTSLPQDLEAGDVEKIK